MSCKRLYWNRRAAKESLLELMSSKIDSTGTHEQQNEFTGTFQECKRDSTGRFQKRNKLDVTVILRGQKQILLESCKCDNEVLLEVYRRATQKIFLEGSRKATKEAQQNVPGKHKDFIGMFQGSSRRYFTALFRGSDKRFYQESHKSDSTSGGKSFYRKVPGVKKEIFVERFR